MSCQRVNPAHRAKLFLILLGGLLFGAFQAPAEALTNAVTVFPAYEAGYLFRIPSLITSTNGTLLAFAEGRKTGTDFGNIDIVMKHSTNSGATWEALRVVGNYTNLITGGADLTVGNPIAVLDRASGRIMLLAQTADAAESSIMAGIGSRRVWITETANAGLTWVAWREITSTVKPSNWRWFATGPGHGVQLQFGNHAGRLIVPVSYTVPVTTNSLLYSSACIYSDNAGLTWQLGAVDGSTNDLLSANETCVVELMETTNGASRLYFNTRNQLGPAPGLRGFAYSHDSGATFVNPFAPALDFVTALCEGSLLRFSFPDTNGASGRVVFSAPNNLNARKWLSLWVSRDETVSWEQPRRVWNGPSGYSDLTRTAAGDLGILFENGSNGILFVTVTAAWLDAPAAPAERPNEGLWNFTESSSGQSTSHGVTNILDRSGAGYHLNLTADGTYPYIAGPTGFLPSVAVSLNDAGGLWLYPSVSPDGNPFDFGAQDSFTVEALVRVPGTETLGNIVGKDWQAKTPSWWLRIQEGGYVRFLVSDSRGNEPSVRSAQKINDGLWHKLAAVRDGASDQLRIYVDGALSAQAADTTTGPLANGRPLTIGRFSYYSSAQNLRGDIAFVRITPAALAPAQFFAWPAPLPPVLPDADGDGEPDLVEYVFVSDPNSAASRPAFTVGVTNAPDGFRIQLDYRKVNDPLVNGGFALSEDLVHWTNSIPGIVELTTTAISEGSFSRMQTIFRDDRNPLAGALFIRLAVFE